MQGRPSGRRLLGEGRLARLGRQCRLKATRCMRRHLLMSYMKSSTLVFYPIMVSQELCAIWTFNEGGLAITSGIDVSAPFHVRIFCTHVRNIQPEQWPTSSILVASLGNQENDNSKPFCTANFLYSCECIGSWKL